MALRSPPIPHGVITNREIRNERLLDEVLSEVTESALENDMDPEKVATMFREQAEAINEHND